MSNDVAKLAQLISAQEAAIAREWIHQLQAAGALQSGRIKEAELQTQCRDFLELLRPALLQGGSDMRHPAYEHLKRMLGELSHARAQQGFSATQTASFVSSLKQVVMENLLQAIVDQAAAYAIIDITGVPTAARLMGADCIISGIRPQIAQTMVHLGVELNVISKLEIVCKPSPSSRPVRSLRRGVRPSGWRAHSAISPVVSHTISTTC